MINVARSPGNHSGENGPTLTEPTRVGSFRPNWKEVLPTNSGSPEKLPQRFFRLLRLALQVRRQCLRSRDVGFRFLGTLPGP
jgi:hypothetical protein